jgi:hypothetical protein
MVNREGYRVALQALPVCWRHLAVSIVYSRPGDLLLAEPRERVRAGQETVEVAQAASPPEAHLPQANVARTSRSEAIDGVTTSGGAFAGTTPIRADLTQHSSHVLCSSPSSGGSDISGEN